MYKSILVLKLSHECAAVKAQSRLRHQKLFRSFNKSFSILKQNGVLAQNLLFSSAGIFRTDIFQIAFRNFRQESGFLALLMVEKGQGLLFASKKGKGLFLTSKKNGI